MNDPVAFSLIIPAHNEEAVIARCLTRVLSDAPDGHAMQIIVAANGCSDRTVEKAQAAAPEALVLDIAEGSKTGAMNSAHQHSRHFPRIYLDADVQCSYRTLAALAVVLSEPGVMAASPQLRMDLSQSNWLVRAYYRVWLTQPYVTDAMVGSGCFGLSRAGYERIGDFPPITGDDIWVHSRFAESERRNVARDHAGNPTYFLVSPPRRAIDQIRVETRRRLGNAQVLNEHPSPHYAGSNRPGDLRAALVRDASPFDVAIYLAIKALARLRARRAKRKSKSIVWERDLMARGGAPNG
jgi:glycosyltransferase involved in cell wall biosynthesis